MVVRSSNQMTSRGTFTKRVNPNDAINLALWSSQPKKTQWSSRTYTRTTGGGGGDNYRNSLLQQYASLMMKGQAEAKAANEARYKQGMGMWGDIAGLYAPGGEFGKGAEAKYERGRTRNLAEGQQQLISSGLSGTTIAAGLPKKYEEEDGTPFKLQLQDLQTSRYADALKGKAGFLERRTDAYPDMSGMLRLFANM